MEHKQIRIIYLSLCILSFLNSCENADMSGMFVSNSLVNDRYDVSMDWNATHPYQEINIASEDYLILNMADSHVGGTENLTKFLNNAKTKNATSVVINGDFCTGHTADYNIFDAKIPHQDTLKSFLTVGNHELYFDGWKEFHKRYGTSIYSFTVKTPSAKDLYICLDSGSGTLGSKQLAWLRNLLENGRANFRNCIIFTHVNLFRIRKTSSTNPNVEELYVLTDLFAKHKVNMVITGHDHIRYVEKFGNTIHISVDALKDGLDNASFLELQISNASINYSFVEI